MKPGTKVTVITPLTVRTSKGRKRYAARRGTYLRTENGERIILNSDGSQTHLERGSGSRVTTKPVDIGPCGVLE